MNHTLKNEYLQLVVSDMGAEMQSVIDTNSGEQYLWQGDPTVWAGRAPILFPIVGALKDGQMLHNGQTYELPRHGLARKSRFELTDASDISVTYTLQADEQTLKIYPWQFSLQVSYTLNNNRVDIDYRVSNTSKETMSFALGSHPAFCLPEPALEQYHLKFSNPESLQRYKLNNDGLLSSTSEPFPITDNRITLSSTLFNDDALVFKSINSGYISLYHQQHERLRVHAGGAPQLGLWSKPGASFVCIEPWFGYSDDESSTGLWADKQALLTLNAYENFDHRWGIEIISIDR